MQVSPWEGDNEPMVVPGAFDGYEKSSQSNGEERPRIVAAGGAKKIEGATAVRLLRPLN